MEENLISSFFSALMSFTSEVMGNRIKTVEMNGIKFVIMKKEKLYYGLLCKSIENLLLLKHLTSEINSLILHHAISHNLNLDSEYIISEELDRKIDLLLDKNTTGVFNVRKEETVNKYLKELSNNEEIKGILFLTDKGNLLYSSLEKINLKRFLKEVNFRVKIWNNSILKLFYTSKYDEIIFSEYVDSYFVILIFPSSIKFGLAEYYLHKAVNFIHEALAEDSWYGKCNLLLSRFMIYKKRIKIRSKIRL